MAPPSVVYDIGGFHVDTRRRLLLSPSGTPIPLAHKVFEALLYFVEHRGLLLEKRTLLSALWPEAVVEENNLNQVIMTLRRALGERRGEHRFIVTVPGRGYRFVAQAQICPDPAPPQTRSPRIALAVLPFTNLAGEPERALCEGIATELIHLLAQAPQLRVLSRTSSFAYRGRSLDVRIIGRELGCDVVVEGSVSRADGELQVTAELIDARSGFHLASHGRRGSPAQLLTLTQELTGALVRSLAQEGAGGQMLARQGTQDPEAYRRYLQGMALLDLGADVHVHRSAVALLEQAIAQDPLFARAYAAAALAHYRVATWGEAPRMHLDATQRLAQQGLALDAGLAQAEHMLGLHRACCGRWLEAEMHFHRALLLDESLAGQTAHAFNVTAAVGHLRAALREGQEACRRAPGSALIHAQLACFYSFLGLDPHALEQVALAASLGWPERAIPSTIVLAQAARRSGRLVEAAEHMAALFPADLAVPGVPALLRRMFTAMGNPEARAGAVAAMRSCFARQPQAILQTRELPMVLMYCATLLQDLDLAYEIAQHRLEDFERTGVMAVVGFLPQLWLPEQRALRQDPRFPDFVARLGLLDYWQRYGPPDDCELRGGRLCCP